MKRLDGSKQADTLDKTVNSKQIHIIVDGCKVKLNFPPESEGAAIKDVKRMMLDGVVKS